MAYGYPYPQPAIPGYFNTNYMPQQQPQFQPQQIAQQNSMNLVQVPDELTALNAQFPMDGSPAFFILANGEEIYSKQLSMANGSVIFRKYRRDEKNKNSEPAYVTHAEMKEKLDEIYQFLGTATAPATSAEGSDKR